MSHPPCVPDGKRPRRRCVWPSSVSSRPAGAPTRQTHGGLRAAGVVGNDGVGVDPLLVAEHLCVEYRLPFHCEPSSMKEATRAVVSKPLFPPLEGSRRHPPSFRGWCPKRDLVNAGRRKKCSDATSLWYVSLDEFWRNRLEADQESRCGTFRDGSTELAQTGSRRCRLASTPSFELCAPNLIELMNDPNLADPFQKQV